MYHKLFVIGEASYMFFIIKKKINDIWHFIQCHFRATENNTLKFLRHRDTSLSNAVTTDG